MEPCLSPVQGRGFVAFVTAAEFGFRSAQFAFDPLQVQCPFGTSPISAMEKPANAPAFTLNCPQHRSALGAGQRAHSSPELSPLSPPTFPPPHPPPPVFAHHTPHPPTVPPPQLCSLAALHMQSAFPCHRLPECKMMEINAAIKGFFN